MIELLKVIVKTIDDKKGMDLVVINVEHINPLTSFYIIVTAESERQTEAIALAIEDELALHNYPIHHIEGRKEKKWVLVDANDFVIHIFYKDERQKYNLERLWLDQELIPVESLLID